MHSAERNIIKDIVRLEGAGAVINIVLSIAKEIEAEPEPEPQAPTTRPHYTPGVSDLIPRSYTTTITTNHTTISAPSYTGFPQRTLNPLTRPGNYGGRTYTITPSVRNANKQFLNVTEGNRLVATYIRFNVADPWVLAS